MDQAISAKPTGALRPAWQKSTTQLAVLALFTLVTRASSYGNPLYSGDDQIYWLIGNGWLHGALPYVDIWDRKPPGLYLLYAAIAAFGGSGVEATWWAGCAFAFLTAVVISRMAAYITGPQGQVSSGIAYLAALAAFAGGAGQAQVFFNLFVAAAGLLTLRAVADPSANLLQSALSAMALCGIALTFKQTTVVEGAFFGLVFLFALHRRGERPMAIICAGLAMAVVAVTPTLLFAIYFWSIGSFGEYWFATALSIFNKGSDRGLAPIGGLAYLLIYSWPIIAYCAMAARQLGASPDKTQVRNFILWWIVAAAIGVAIIPRFYQYYGIPLFVPMTVFSGVVFQRRTVGLLFLAVWIFYAAMQGSMVAFKGSALSRQGYWSMNEVIATHAKRRCLFVYDGPPRLYATSGTCASTSYQFPDHLALRTETNAAASDTLAEIKRIIASEPGIIVIKAGPALHRNVATDALVMAAIRSDYCLIARRRFPVDFKPTTFQVFALKPNGACRPTRPVAFF